MWADEVDAERPIGRGVKRSLKFSESEDIGKETPVKSDAYQDLVILEKDKKWMKYKKL